MVPGKEKGGLIISILTEKIPGGKKGIKVTGLKLNFDLKRFQIIIRELQRKKGNFFFASVCIRNYLFSGFKFRRRRWLMKVEVISGK
jgi:hypothetical protein